MVQFVTTMANAMQMSGGISQLVVDKFSGDSKEYCKFMFSFNNKTENKLTSDSNKLNHLIKKCTGAAKSAIDNCI